jgi:hypothetical protein
MVWECIVIAISRVSHRCASLGPPIQVSDHLAFEVLTQLGEAMRTSVLSNQGAQKN